MTAVPAARRPAAPPAVLRHLPLALAVVLVLTAIAYPLASGTGRDVVSWAIVLLGSALSVAHATASRSHGSKSSTIRCTSHVSFTPPPQCCAAGQRKRRGRLRVLAALR